MYDGKQKKTIFALNYFGITGAFLFSDNLFCDVINLFCFVFPHCNTGYVCRT